MKSTLDLSKSLDSKKMKAISGENYDIEAAVSKLATLKN